MLQLKDVKETFEKELKTPNIDKNMKILAPSLGHHSLVGTAFDYLLRFYIERLNPKVKTEDWIAETIDVDQGIRTIKKMIKVLRSARRSYEEYIKTGIIDDDICKTCLSLSYMDIIRRIGYTNWDFINFYEGDITDLKNLISVVNPENFRTNNICIVNPTFGKASELVGGADCDLIINDTIIDIKTIKDPAKRFKKDFHQVVGYYILYKIGSIKGVPKNHQIKNVGLYYSRHGILLKFPVNDIIDEKDLQRFIKWFKERAKRAEKEGEGCFEYSKPIPQSSS